jgi:YegS/Rv2252/BmrU family lipid kinase
VDRVVLIVNPAARGGRFAEHAALSTFRALGVEAEVWRTAAPGDAARLAMTNGSEETIFVLGGDGTVMEVVGALANSGRAVGILPGGTGNQLARLLGIPLDVGAAVRALHRQKTETRLLDLGRLADGRHFAITAGVGMDAAMIAGASPLAKRWIGVGAYLLSAVGPAFAARSFPVRVEADGQVFEREAALAMIANVGAVMGGRFSLAPGATPDDGMLDVCILSPRGFVDGTALAVRMLRQDFRDDPRWLFARAREVRIEAPAGTPAQADGELLVSAALHAVAVPNAARFLVPRR